MGNTKARSPHARREEADRFAYRGWLIEIQARESPSIRNCYASLSYQDKPVCCFGLFDHLDATTAQWALASWACDFIDERKDTSIGLQCPESSDLLP